MNDTEQLYQEYHENCPFEDFGRDSFQGDKAVAAFDDVHTALDFGCGNGYAVRKMRSEGHAWFGVEYSKAAYERYLREPFFFLGNTSQFGDAQFDLVYSTEVLEHIPEDQIDWVIGDLCRIARKYIFVTISLRPSSDNNRYHCTLRPRDWWESRFMRCGFEVDRRVVDRFQPRTLKSTRATLKRWAHLGPAAREFAEHPPFRLFGEKQPWFFVFRRRDTSPRPLPKPTVSWSRRKLVPLARRVLRIDARWKAA